MVKFRTKYNPGSYVDYEHYEPGTSLTEPGQAETMEQLMARLTRVPTRPIAFSDLNDKEVDELMVDSELDEYEDEGRTGMAAAMDTIGDAIVQSRKEEVAEQASEEAVRMTSKQANATDDEAPAKHPGDDKASSGDA